MAFSSICSGEKILQELPCHLLLQVNFFHTLWRRAKNLSIFFNESERAFADSIKDICGDCYFFVRSLIGFDASKNIRVYVLASWHMLLKHSMPRARLILVLILWVQFLFLIYYSQYGYVYLGDYLFLLGFLMIALVIDVLRARAGWNISAGLVQDSGRWYSLIIKPPQTAQSANREIGRRIWIDSLSQEEYIRLTCCHEMAHVFTFHLKYPSWFNEGLAMLFEEKYLGKQVIRTDTLKTIEDSVSRHISRVNQVDYCVLLYSRAYWRVRLIADTQPEILGLLLSSKYTHAGFKKLIAQEFGYNVKQFWKHNEFDSLVLRYYSELAS